MQFSCDAALYIHLFVSLSLRFEMLRLMYNAEARAGCFSKRDLAAQNVHYGGLVDDL